MTVKDLETQVDLLQAEFRIFRDNHFYHFQRDMNTRLDRLEEAIKDKRLWIALGVIVITGFINLVKV